LAIENLLPAYAGNGSKGLRLNSGATALEWVADGGGTVTSVAATVPSFLSIAGSPITTSGTLAFTLSGTALPTTSGGTGLTSFTSGGVVYASSSSALATGSALNFDGTTLTNSSGAFQGYDNLTLTAYASGTNGTVVNINSAGTGGITKFSINGTETFRTTSSSLYTASGINVGIGTSSPATKLEVSGNALLSGVSGYKYLYFNGVTENSSLRFAKIGKNYDSTFELGLWASTHSAGNSAATVFYRDLTTESMRLDSAGNLGLGVTPSAWVAGSKAMQVGAVGAVYESSNGYTTIGYNAYEYASNAWKYIFSGGSAPASRYEQVGSGHRWYVAPAGSGGSIISFTQAMTLDASGNLLVGDTSLPASNRVKGFAALSNSTGGIQIYQTANNSDLAINTTSGNVFNFYSDSGSALVYSGSIAVNGVVTTYGSVSDYRLKENVQPMQNALAKVLQLKPVTFAFKNSGQVSQGFIAHELQAVCPDAVTGEKDAVDADGKPQYQGVDTSFLVATLTAAIQEQQAMIESLRQRLSAANL
jgi:hypothetical protein